MLFSVCDHAFINTQSDRFADIQRAAAQCEQVTTFAVEGEAQYRAEHIESDKEGMAFDLHAAGETHHLTTAMKGIFNVENALAAATVASTSAFLWRPSRACWPRCISPAT